MDVKKICQKYDINPTKARGQNFLIDNNIVKKIAESANLTEQDLVLEVGPGLGILTEQLLAGAGQVIAVELDKKIVPIIQKEFAAFLKDGRLILEEADILRADLRKFKLKDFEYKIVANLPYNITSKFLRQFLELGPKPKEMVIMIQKEVAIRLMAKSGNMSLLSLSVQFFSDPKMLFTVGANCFWPAPKVESAVVFLKLKQNLPEIDVKELFRLARFGFSAKRKQLHNNLASGLKLKNEQIKNIFQEFGWDEKIRAQDLSVEDWIRLAKAIQKLSK